MKNDSLKTIAGIMDGAEKILIFPHVNLDGDAVGSCAALCAGLRQKGKEAWVLLEDEIPANLRFLDRGFCATDQNVIKDPDVCICLDCSDSGRFPLRAEKFFSAPVTICADHHMTDKFSCDYNYVDSREAATGQIVYELLLNLGVDKDPLIGEAIYAAIATDTGDFTYSNTQKKSHLIAAELFDWGCDFNKVSVQLYENVRVEKIRLRSAAMESLRIIGGGPGAMVTVTQDMLRKTGADMDESEGLAQDLRSISGVEYSAVLKEYGPENIRVSLRAKRFGNVEDIARRLGGGGHVKAAGCTIRRPLSEAEALVEREILRAVKGLKKDE